MAGGRHSLYLPPEAGGGLSALLPHRALAESASPYISRQDRLLLRFPAGIDPRDYPVYRAAKGLYCGKLLITSAELADEEQVSSEAFGDILNAMLIARYGKTIIAAEVKK